MVPYPTVHRWCTGPIRFRARTVHKIFFPKIQYGNGMVTAYLPMSWVRDDCRDHDPYSMQTFFIWVQCHALICFCCHHSRGPWGHHTSNEPNSLAIAPLQLSTRAHQWQCQWCPPGSLSSSRTYIHSIWSCCNIAGKCADREAETWTLEEIIALKSANVGRVAGITGCGNHKSGKRSGHKRKFKLGDE